MGMGKGREGKGRPPVSSYRTPTARQSQTRRAHGSTHGMYRGYRSNKGHGFPCGKDCIFHFRGTPFSLWTGLSTTSTPKTPRPVKDVMPVHSAAVRLGCGCPIRLGRTASPLPIISRVRGVGGGALILHLSARLLPGTWKGALAYPLSRISLVLDGFRESPTLWHLPIRWARPVVPRVPVQDMQRMVTVCVGWGGG